MLRSQSDNAWEQDNERKKRCSPAAVEFLLSLPEPFCHLELIEQYSRDLLAGFTPEELCWFRVRDYRWSAYQSMTFRRKRPGGHLTELDHILAGIGRAFIYGYETAERDGKLHSVIAADLRTLRETNLLVLENEDPNVIQNRDLSADFLEIRWSTIQKIGACVQIARAQSHPPRFPRSVNDPVLPL